MTGSERARQRGRVMLGAAIVFALLVVVAVVLILADPWPTASDPGPGDSTESPVSPPPDDPTDEPAASDPPDSSPASPGPTDPADSGTAGPTPSAPTDVPSSAPVTTAGPLDDDSAQEVVGSYLTAAAGLETDTTDVSARVNSIAGESLIAELEADLLELDSQGWQRTGAPVAVSATVIDQDENSSPPTATVQACIDSSDVQVVDAAGEPLPNDPSANRALNVYTLAQNDDGAWIIVSRSFPPDPSC